MIDWLIFLPACFALNLAFGPNNLLSLTHGARCGILFAQQAALGRILCFIPMIAASALGLGAILTASAFVFTVVKVIGAAYLIWLGISLWRSANSLNINDLPTTKPSLAHGFKAEALVAISNPKAILIFAAFFPQFVSVEAYWQSFALLGAAFLIMECFAIFAYAAFGKFASRLAAHRLPILQRVSGLTMCLFGALLLASPSPSSRH